MKAETTDLTKKCLGLYSNCDSELSIEPPKNQRELDLYNSGFLDGENKAGEKFCRLYLENSELITQTKKLMKIRFLRKLKETIDCFDDDVEENNFILGELSKLKKTIEEL